MEKISTLQRLLLPLALAVIVLALVLASLQSGKEIQVIEHNAQTMAQAQSRLLKLTQSLVGDKVKTSMRLLRREADAIGSPNIQGTTTLNGKVIPNLYLGKTPQTNSVELVDRVTSIVDGTATLFVKSGDDYIRIATNIKKPHRERATGTELDPDGKAIKAIHSGGAFYGVVDILGNPYITGYEPMYDESGEIIGLWYVGYEADIQALRETVESTRFLESGFAVIIDEHNVIRFISSHISKQTAKKLLHDRPKTWNFVSEDMPSWGYKIILAYPAHEALSAGLIKGLYIIGGGVFILLLVAALIRSQLRRLVITPIGGDPADAVALVRRISRGDLAEDGLTAKSGTLMADMLKMRVNLRELIETLHENSEGLSLAASVFEHTHDGIFITDAKVNIIQVNPAFERLTGFSRQEAVGKHPRQLNFAKINNGKASLLSKAVKNKGEWHGEIKNKHKNGKGYIASLDISTVHDEHGDVRYYVGVFSDITLMKQQQQSLEHMAYHDALTKLPNRALFSDRLHHALAKAKRSKEMLAVCYIDLDGFKPVNDELGHDAGDDLLVQLSERIRDSLRPGDTIARMGGDEFSLLLCDLKSEQEAHLTLQRILDSIKAPYTIKRKKVTVSASAGMVINISPEEKPEMILRQADQAMYQAKLGQGNTYHVYTETK
ncbi:MAG TPA: diguanylate cyclase [Methylophilaceae bacterium]|nr:diguanylate cyclase [Methylophilaceae bacterium]